MKHALSCPTESQSFMQRYEGLDYLALAAITSSGARGGCKTHVPAAARCWHGCNISVIMLPCRKVKGEDGLPLAASDDEEDEEATGRERRSMLNYEEYYPVLLPLRRPQDEGPEDEPQDDEAGTDGDTDWAQITVRGVSRPPQLTAGGCPHRVRGTAAGSWARRGCRAIRHQRRLELLHPPTSLPVRSCVEGR